MLVGELNGKPIAALSAIKYPDGYSHFGSFIVKEKYRKRGYGATLAEFGIANCAPIKNMSAYAVQEMAKAYETTYCLLPRWTVVKHDIDITKA